MSLRLMAGLALLCLLSACGKTTVSRESYVFGTRVEITALTAAPGPASSAIDAALRDLDTLHHELHAWQPGPLTQLNAAFAHGQALTTTADIRELIGMSQQQYALGDGLFNPAIGGLIAAWGFHSDSFAPIVPPAATVQQWVRAQPSPLDVDISSNLVRSRNPAVRLDFGGIAKGWALDRVAKQLRAHAVTSALINIGGNIMALGEHSDRPWQVGLQHPRQPEAMLDVELHDGEAIGTSGDYQRFFIAGGKRYSHLIDPRTGYPASDITSATIIVKPGPHAGMLSDAASKPLFIGGAERAAMYARRFGIVDWLVVRANGDVYLSRDMQHRVHWLIQPPKVVAVD